jgi:hypothetical protein
MVDGWLHGVWEGDWLVIRQGQRIVRIKPTVGTIIESTRTKQDSTIRYVHRAKADPA